MATLQDELNEKLPQLVLTDIGIEEIAHQIKEVETEAVSADASFVEDDLGEIIKQRLARRRSLLEVRSVEDAFLVERHNRFIKAEENLRVLYAERPEIETILAEERRKLSEAEARRFTPQIQLCKTRIHGLETDLAENATFVAQLETRYPELQEKLASERSLIVHQQKLQKIADLDVAAKLLLSRSEIERLKQDLENRHDILTLVEMRSGFCFVPIRTDVEADLFSYRAIPKEMLVRYMVNKQGQEIAKAHTIRIEAVTVPNLVDNFFFTREGKRVDLTLRFDHLHELHRWEKINRIVQISLMEAVRRAEYRRREAQTWETLKEVSGLKTVDEIANGEAGTAVIHITRYQGRYDLGFRIVSDGTTVRSCFCTERSKKHPLYEALAHGQEVAKFFVREDDSFSNKELQEIFVLNEKSYELGHLIFAAMVKHGAERVSRANDNATAFAMPIDQGGRDGVYMVTLSVAEKKGRQAESHRNDVVRETAYVVARTDDNVTFVAGLTRYSRVKFTEQGFEFNKPYALAELRGYTLYVLQRVYSAVTETPYDNLPDHLKGARAKAQMRPQVKADSAESPKV